MNAVKRRFGRCRTQDTMIDFFKKLDKAIDEKSPHEFKIGNLRGILKKQYVVDRDQFFICKDFADDRHMQKHPEEYSPIINTLIQYIIFTKTIDKNRWEHVEKQYHQMIKGKPTYQSWHENRQELYRILDIEMKHKRPTVNHVETDVYNIDADENIDDMTDDDLINWVRQRRQNYRRNGQKGRNRPNQGGNRRFDPNFRRAAQRPNRPTPGPSRPINSNNRMDDKKNNLRKLLCRNCSRWAGENKYHLGPYGGTQDSLCPYDDKGRPRPGFQFIRSYYGTAVNEIGVEDYRELESEGIEFEDNNMNTIDRHDSYSMNLITQSMGDIS